MKKVAFLLYGISVYIFFVTTFFYAIGFVSTIGVAKHIDSEPKFSLKESTVTNAVLIILFAFQHSIMARPAFKKHLTRFLPQQLERSTYVLFSCLCLWLLFWKWEPIGGVIWDFESEFVRTSMRSICIAGFAFVIISSFYIGHFHLFGLKQVWMFYRGKHHLIEQSFQKGRIYAYLRHPIHLGFLVGFWSTPVMTAAHLLFAMLITGYFLTGVQLEEHDLIKRYGANYEEYKASAPMIIPFINKFASLKTFFRLPGKK
jgi:methanethiol S-methyltransferase